MMLNPLLAIQPIPAFSDNYIWLLPYGRNAVVVDPGDAAPVLKTLAALELNLAAILITHHHDDHIGGVPTLLAQYPVTVYAPQYQSFDFPHQAVKAGDTIELPAIASTFQVMHLPGHTLDHIAYVNARYLFCGDVLFSAGCGRLFEGTAEQMLQSLQQLKRLPLATQVFCAHEYTAKNIAFALSLDPENSALINRAAEVTALRQQSRPSLPSTIDLELRTNPFLRCQQASIIKNSQAKNVDELSVFSAIRTLRNHY